MGGPSLLTSAVADDSSAWEIAAMNQVTLLGRHARDRRARELRLEMSKTEWRLWYRLRNRQLGGHRFRRQVPIGPYFADFACLGARIVVEVDGEQHAEQRAYDQRRDRWLAELGYRVLRYSVVEIDDNLDGVVEAIRLAVGPPTQPPPAGGGEECKCRAPHPTFPPRARGRSLGAR